MKREPINSCVESIVPKLADNLEYARQVIEQTPHLRDHILVLGPADPGVLKTSIMVWNLFFPDHCRGEAVFFAAVWETVTPSLRFRFAPAVLVACRHFEHGDWSPELRRIETLAEIVALEALDSHGVYNYRIIELDPYREKLLMLISGRLTDDFVYRDFNKALRRTLKLLTRLPDQEDVEEKLAYFIETVFNDFS